MAIRTIKLVVTLQTDDTTLRTISEKTGSFTTVDEEFNRLKTWAENKVKSALSNYTSLGNIHTMVEDQNEDQPIRFAIMHLLCRKEATQVTLQVEVQQVLDNEFLGKKIINIQLVPPNTMLYTHWLMMVTFTD